MRPDPPVVFTDRNDAGSGGFKSATIIPTGGSAGQPVVMTKDTTGLAVGMLAVGSGIPLNTTITEIKPNVSFTLDKPLKGNPTGKISCNNGGDKRNPEEKKWEEEWLKAFAAAKDNKGPRLYLLSIQQQPRGVLAACVEASGGQAKLITGLRTLEAAPLAGVKPPVAGAPAVATTPAAGDTSAAIKGVTTKAAAKPVR